MVVAWLLESGVCGTLDEAVGLIVGVRKGAFEGGDTQVYREALEAYFC